MKWHHWVIVGLCILVYFLINIFILKKGGPDKKRIKWLDDKIDDHEKSIKIIDKRVEKRNKLMKISEEKHIEFEKNIKRMSDDDLDKYINAYG